ncbi:MAG: hypothetical protein L0G69_04865 [Brevibacterium sp.]|nr:hypothetical protein [Brevibacterium sp.]
MPAQPSHQDASLDERTLDLVERVSLSDIHFLKTSAQRGDTPQDESESTKYSADFDMSIDVKDDLSAMRVCVKVQIELDVGEVETEIALVYSGTDGDLGDLPPELLENFVNKVAFMAAFPYLRAEVSALTSKVFGSPLNMPIITQGDITSSQTD